MAHHRARHHHLGRWLLHRRLRLESAAAQGLSCRLVLLGWRWGGLGGRRRLGPEGAKEEAGVLLPVAQAVHVDLEAHRLPRPDGAVLVQGDPVLLPRQQPGDGGYAVGKALLGGDAEDRRRLCLVGAEEGKCSWVAAHHVALRRRHDHRHGGAVEGGARKLGNLRPAPQGLLRLLGAQVITGALARPAPVGGLLAEPDDLRVLQEVERGLEDGVEN
mmetsp:Transcript_24253/g.59807  ORF Transcript_24253/g.59807 Transcript_24253/m.59807 type:complete len:216 (-) Transcript_24253:493-1140(-)